MWLFDKFKKNKQEDEEIKSKGSEKFKVISVNKNLNEITAVIWIKSKDP